MPTNAMKFEDVISVEQLGYHTKDLVEDLKSECLFYKLAFKHEKLPKRHGNVYSWRKIGELTNDTTIPLKEGVTPDFDKIKLYNFTTSIFQYGNPLQITDVMKTRPMDDILAETVSLMKVQARETVNQVIIKELEKTANVYYSKGTNLDTTTGLLNVAELNNIKRILKRQKVRPYDGTYYLMVISPECEYDFKNETGNHSFIEVMKYADPTKIIKGEIGTIAGFRIITDDYISVVKNTGGDSICKGIVLGAQAYQTIDLDGESAARPEIIHQPSTDPLKQRETIGWKIDGFGSNIYRDEAVLLAHFKQSLPVEGIEIADEERYGYKTSVETPVVNP